MATPDHTADAAPNSTTSSDANHVSPERREARSLVRIALADAFPGIRFGITLGDRPVVTWTGGPFEHEVFAILDDFEENMITSSYMLSSRLFLTPSGRVVKQPEPLSVGLTIGRWRHNFRDELTRFPTAAEARIMRCWLAGCPSVPDDFVSRIRFGRRRASFGLRPVSFGHMPAPHPGYPDRDSAEGNMLEKCLSLLVLAGHRPGPRLWLAEPSG